MWLEESSVLRRVTVHESTESDREPITMTVRELLLSHGCWWTRGTTMMEPQPESLKRLPWAIGHVELIQVLSGEVNANQPIALLVTSDAQSAARSVDIFLKLRQTRRRQHDEHIHTSDQFASEQNEIDRTAAGQNTLTHNEIGGTPTSEQPSPKGGAIGGVV